MKTTINVECMDQELVITNSPIIASGGVHENFIAFNFCEKWDGLGKTAVFYRNEKERFYSVLGPDDVCEIPHEVTDYEGNMYFGVYGEAGDVTKTSKVLKYRIIQGAMTTLLKPSEEPTPDIYQQLLSAYGQTNEALEREKAEREASMNALNREILAEENARKSAILAEENARKQADATEKAERQAEIAVERERINQLTRMEEGSTTGDVELMDIRVGADGKTYTNAGEAVRSQVGKLSSDVTELQDILLERNVIIPSGNGDASKYSFYVPIGAKIKAETVSGNVFGATTMLRFRRADKTMIDYWTLNKDIASRTFDYTLSENAYYISLSDAISEDVKVTILNEDNLIKRVETLETNIGNNNCLSCVEIKHTQLRNGSTANLNNTEAVSTYVIKTNAKAIRVYTDRPNTYNCEYGYGFVTALKDIKDSAGNADKTFGFVDYDNKNPYYELYSHEGGCFGVSVCIGEINKSSGAFSPLRVTDFEGYTITIYDATGEYFKNKENSPQFYDSYLTNRIGDIRNKDLLVANNGDSFIFITDLHDQNNFYSPTIAKRIIEETSVNHLVYGGDYINEPTSKELAIKQLFERVAKCRVVDDAIFLVGNHDTHAYGGGEKLTQGECYSILHKHLEKHFDTGKKTYFYRDNEVQKIRYFYIDSGENGVLDDVQAEWLKDNADSLTSEWTIVVLSHFGIYTNTIDDRTNIVSYGCIDTIKTALSTTQANIACIVCGHTHIDLADTTGDYPIICTTCDAHGAQASSMSTDNRTVDTINEQAFDVFHIDTLNRKIYTTRIGGGQNNVIASDSYDANDREFSY